MNGHSLEKANLAKCQASFISVSVHWYVILVQTFSVVSNAN